MKEIRNYRSKDNSHEVLNKGEVKKLVKCINNIKHEAMIMLAYSSGLSVCVFNLKVILLLVDYN